MKQNNVKLNARLNAVGNAYAKATGMPIVGEMMMAASAGGNDNYKALGAGFECNPFESSIVAAVALIAKTTEELATQEVTIQYEDDVQTLEFSESSVIEVDEEIVQLLSEETGEDYSAYIGWYFGNYFAEYNCIEGETYTFYVNGKLVATETGIDCGSGNGELLPAPDPTNPETGKINNG